MDLFTNLKKHTKIGLWIFSVLTVVIFLFQLSSVIFGIRGISETLHPYADFVMVAAIFGYAFFGYKKPHGNLLRYLFFFFGLYLAAHAVLGLSENSHVVSCCLILLAALVVTYLSGRLDRIEKNRKLLILTGLLLLASWVITNFIPVQTRIVIPRLLGSAGNMIYLGAIGFAYTARYEEHRLAGLKDGE